MAESLIDESLQAWVLAESGDCPHELTPTKLQRHRDGRVVYCNQCFEAVMPPPLKQEWDRIRLGEYLSRDGRFTVTRRTLYWATGESGRLYRSVQWTLRDLGDFIGRYETLGEAQRISEAEDVES